MKQVIFDSITKRAFLEELDLIMGEPGLNKFADKVGLFNKGRQFLGRVIGGAERAAPRAVAPKMEKSLLASEMSTGVGSATKRTGRDLVAEIEKRSPMEYATGAKGTVVNKPIPSALAQQGRMEEQLNRAIASGEFDPSKHSIRQYMKSGEIMPRAKSVVNEVAPAGSSRGAVATDATNVGRPREMPGAGVRTNTVVGGAPRATPQVAPQVAPQAAQQAAPQAASYNFAPPAVPSQLIRPKAAPPSRWNQAANVAPWMAAAGGTGFGANAYANQR